MNRKLKILNIPGILDFEKATIPCLGYLSQGVLRLKYFPRSLGLPRAKDYIPHRLYCLPLQKNAIFN